MSFFPLQPFSARFISCWLTLRDLEAAACTYALGATSAKAAATPTVVTPLLNFFFNKLSITFFLLHLTRQKRNTCAIMKHLYFGHLAASLYPAFSSRSSKTSASDKKNLS